VQATAHGSQREDIKEYLKRMERVIAQAEEMHLHTVVQSNSSTRRSNFARRQSYSGQGSIPEGHEEGRGSHPLRRSYCLATDERRQNGTKLEDLPGKAAAAQISRGDGELLDSGATLSDWMEENAERGEGLGAPGEAAADLAPVGRATDDVLLDPEACLTFRIGSDGVPVSESDCDSVVMASPVRGTFQSSPPLI